MTDLELVEKYGLETVARYNFKFFFVRVLGYKWNRWYEKVYQDLDKQLLLVQVSRGHGKTVFFSAYAIWLIYSGRPEDILFVSYSEDQVKNNIMNLIDRIIMNNDYLSHLRPSPKQMWGAQLKTFKTGAQIRGESFGSSVRGAHPTRLFVDDPLKDRGGMTPEEQFMYYSTSLMGTCRRDTQVIVDGTPLDNGDLLEQLEKSPDYIVHKFPARDVNGEPLFPELYTHDDLVKIERRNSFAWSREYMLQRIDPKAQVFKDRFRTINETFQFPEFTYLRTFVDPAISAKETACNTAIQTSGLDSKSHLWEMDTRLLQADDPTLIIDEIVKVARLYKDKCYDYAVVIESQLFQKVLAYDLRQRFLDERLDVHVIEITHTSDTGKSQRIIGLQTKWEARAIHLLPDSVLIPQFRYFRPNAKGLLIDGIDAMSFVNLDEVTYPQSGATAYDPGVPEGYGE